MLKLKHIVDELYLVDEINNAKIIFKELQKMYPDVEIPVFEFKDLKGRGSGYLTTYKIKGGKYIFIKKMTIDNSGRSDYSADYAVCHEFAHAILATTKNTLTHNKEHDNLTYKLAKKFDLV